MNNLSNVTFNMLGASEVTTAVLNVLAVIGLVLAAAFIIVFLSDLIISVIDHKNGIFFKRKDKEDAKVKNLELEDDLTDKKKEEVKEEKQESNVNMELAEEERLALQEQNRKQQEENEDLKQRIAALEAKQAEANQVHEPESTSKELTDEELDKMYNDLIAEINSEKEEEEDEEDFDLDKFLNEDEDDKKEEPEVEEKVEEPEVVEEVEEPTPVEEVVEEEKINEDAEKLAELQRQIEELQSKLDSQNQEKEDIAKQLEEEQGNKEALAKQLEEEQTAKEALAKQLEEEQSAKDELAKQLEEKPEVIEVPTMVEGANLDTMEGLLAQKEDLENRLKETSKQLSANKKEYIPLARIKRTLEKDEAKLRRREAIVAKQKITLFGVSNYVVDPEKERELSEELDQLEALRLSVQHCEEVMDENKDRYPLLENTNKILVQTVAHIKADIEAVDQKIEKMKSTQGEDGSQDSTGDADNQ